MPKKSRGNPTIRALALVGPGPALRHARRVQKFCSPLQKDGAHLGEMCASLNAAGLLTWRGRRWRVPNLHGVLKQPTG